jgi:hypothetical protein
VRDSVRALAKCRPVDPRALANETLAEIRNWCAILGAAGWTLMGIATELDCSDDSLSEYRSGKRTMPVDKWKRLRRLAELYVNGNNRRVG